MKRLIFFRSTIFFMAFAMIGVPVTRAEDQANSPTQTQNVQTPSQPTPVLTPQPATTLSALSTEKASAIHQTAEKLVREEMDTIGSFEVDHPETGDLLNLSLDAVGQEVKQSDEGEYLLRATFKDQAGAVYAVDLYVEELGEGEYELADAIIMEIDGKQVSGV